MIDSDIEGPQYSPLSIISGCMDSCEGSYLSDEEFPGKCMHVVFAKTENSQTHHTGYIDNLCFLLPNKSPAVSQYLEELPTVEMLWGFKIVGDNADKNVKASFLRHEI